MCSKIPLTERQAGAMVNDAKRHNHLHHMKKIPLRKYRCPECGQYHVTSSRSWRGEE